MSWRLQVAGISSAVVFCLAACSTGESSDTQTIPPQPEAPGSLEFPSAHDESAGAAEALLRFGAVNQDLGDFAVTSINGVKEMSDVVVVGALGAPLPGRAVGFGDVYGGTPSFETALFQLEVEEVLLVRSGYSSRVEPGTNVWLEYYVSFGAGERALLDPEIAGARVVFAGVDYTTPASAHVFESEGFPARPGELIIGPMPNLFMVEMPDGSVSSVMAGAPPVLVTRALGLPDDARFDELVDAARQQLR